MSIIQWYKKLHPLTVKKSRHNTIWYKFMYHIQETQNKIFKIAEKIQCMHSIY